MTRIIILSYSCKHNEKSIYDNIDMIDLILFNYEDENEWLWWGERLSIIVELLVTCNDLCMVAWPYRGSDGRGTSYSWVPCVRSKSFSSQSQSPLSFHNIHRTVSLKIYVNYESLTGQLHNITAKNGQLLLVLFKTLSNLILIVFYIILWYIPK